MLRLLGLGAICALAVPAVSRADDAQIPASYLLDGAESPISVYVAAARAEGGDAGSGLGASVDNGTLDGLSGGTSITQNTSLSGTVANDSADHTISGANIINGNAFSGETGIPMVIQNSGNNVLIQNATVINVEFKQ